ncbi:MAG: glycosyltransferase family 2 protein [Candidatus Woykebacteria bacterium]
MEKNNPTFSIIIPTFNRDGMLRRSINSILHQTYPHWELIIVNDGSTDNTEEVVKSYKDKRINYLRNPQRMERAISLNNGMRATKNDWICWLGSDDEFTSCYLESLASAISKHQTYKIFNYGVLKYENNWEVTVFEPFYPSINPFGGHDPFPPGRIGCGGFTFHRSLLKEVGELIERKDPKSFADEAKREFPVLNRYIASNKTLGEPWGEDYYMFFKLTRNHHTKTLNTALYLIHGKYKKDWDAKVLTNREKLSIKPNGKL